MTVKSKGNKSGNGFPIATGLIFLGDSIQELVHTKIMLHSEYQKWLKERTESGIKLLPSEPVGSFDLGDKVSHTFSLDNPRPCKFIKFVPTNFREKPVNFKSKSFLANLAEVQFFGVSGVELDSLCVDQPSDFTVPSDSPLKVPV